MRELRENLYLFSISPESYGKIIAQRTHDGECFEGENIFELLKIDRSELKYLNGIRKNDSNLPQAVVGRRSGKERIVLFGMSVSIELPMGVAMEFTHPAHAFASLYGDNEDYRSPNAKRLINAYESEAYDPENEMSVSSSIAAFCKLGDSPCEERDVYLRISDMLSTVAELVCLPIEYSVMRDESFTNDDSMLLHVSSCLFVAITMAMAARRHSPKRKLYAYAVFKNSFLSLSLGYEGDGEPWRGESLFKMLIDDGEMICEISNTDGRVLCSMAPCYLDEGLLGVKEHMSDLKLLEFWK